MELDGFAGAHEPAVVDQLEVDDTVVGELVLGADGEAGVGCGEEASGGGEQWR